MTQANNNIKTSAAMLIFFLSAAAWATRDLIEEEHALPQNTQARSGNVNDEMVPRPLTD